MFGETPYRDVVCLAHVVDRDGQKMSKSRGNVVDPWDVLQRKGADALRWYFFSSGSPWTNRRVYEEGIDEAVRKFLLTLWNTYAFAVTYANLDAWAPGDAVPSTGDHVLDRWVVSRLQTTIGDVTRALEGFDALVMPGGESTTIGFLLDEHDLAAEAPDGLSHLDADGPAAEDLRKGRPPRFEKAVLPHARTIS